MSAARVFSVSSLALAVVMLAIEGTWRVGLPHNPVFLCTVVFIMTGLGIGLCRDIRNLRSKEGLRLAKVGGAVCHLGFLITLAGGFFGALCFEQGKVMLVKGESGIEHGVDPSVSGLPFGISLEEFKVEYYEDGVSPKQYTSEILIDGERKSVSVNSPARHKGYFFYQSDYDRSSGDISVLSYVKDPLLYVVLFGMLLLAVGSLMSLAALWKPSRFLPVVLALAAVFTVVSLWRINFGILAPALRSGWFIPHIVCYMIAYSCVVLSLVCGAVSLVKGRPGLALSRRLLSTSSSLLVLGMLCGAVWAKFAWGDYWTWDAKECWAGATWLLTLLTLHIPVGSTKRRILLFVLLVALCFAAMQTTWLGVNHLPAAQYSLHTY